MNRFIWSLDGMRKVKIKEIREYKIVHKEDAYVVEVYGFFGGWVEIFQINDLKSCRLFIDELTGMGKQKEIEE